MQPNFKAMWTPGMESIFKGADPQAVASEIYSISDTPTKHQVVEKARDEHSAMHGLFEWDNEIAGEKWREEQASHIMRHLKITFVNAHPDGEEKKKYQPVRLFYGDPVKSEGFRSIITIMENKDQYNQLLARAKMELKAFRNKYSMLKELEAVFDVIDTI